MRRWITLLIVIAVIGGSFALYQLTGQEKEPPPPDYETYTVTRGDIYATISATGIIEPSQEVNLNFETQGKVKEIMAEVGDAVRPGQVLARLEDDDLQLQLKKAEAALAVAEANRDKALAPADEFTLAAAQAQLESARAQAEAARAAYQDLLRGPTSAQRRVAEAQLKRAEVALKHAQEAYDKIAHLPNAGMMPLAIQLEQATIDYETAKANLEVTLAPPTKSKKAQALAQIAAAEAAAAQAEANLHNLQQGPSPEDVAVLQAQVEQALIGVEAAQLALKKAQIISPITGVVGDISIQLDELPAPGKPAIVLLNPEGFHIQLSVDELDIGKLQVGQKALITVDALEDAQLTGKVTHIAPVANSTPVGGGVITTYEVRIDLDDTNLPLRSGMSATASIITQEAKDVIRIPNRVMHLDQEKGEPYVEKLVDGIPTRVYVQLGLRNEQFSEVVQGLKEGDVLAIRRVDSSELLRRQLFGGE